MRVHCLHFFSYYRARLVAYLITILLAFFSFVYTAAAQDPLPSWNDTATKRTIVDFVQAVIDPNNDAFVEPADRIATFDNDGCLWTEKPMYIHFFAVFDHMKEQMTVDPSLKNRQPYKALASKEKDYFINLYENSSFDTLLGQLIGVPFGGMTVDQFSAWGRQWLATWRHPRFKVGYKQLIYQPMLELISYLETNAFTVHIFTADEGAFLRLAADEIYGLPPERVHGSSVRIEYVVEDGRPELVRTYQADYLNNWAGKPRLIQKNLGKHPILAAGNSNGDLHMLQYVAQQDRRSLSLLVHHTDAAREYAYDKHTDKVIPLARKEGWTIIDMKNDWKTVFPQG